MILDDRRLLVTGVTGIRPGEKIHEVTLLTPYGDRSLLVRRSDRPFAL